MSDPLILRTPHGRDIAYHLTDGAGPAVVFLGGFKSDMDGSKATYLEAWAKREGRAFLRFDYSGHGQSAGQFTDGTIGAWYEDACDVIGLIGGPLVLVGSSMGGWIALQVARAKPDWIAGLVGIAAAPDFTEDGFNAGFTPEQRATLDKEGQVALPSEYGEPYIITKQLIQEGRTRLVMRDPLPLPFPVRLLQGTEDTAVTTETALALLAHGDSPDIRLTLVKGADHSFSDETCLPIILQSIAEVS